MIRSANTPATEGKTERNLITPHGLKALKEEYRHLWTVERPKTVDAVWRAAQNGDRSENGDYLYNKKRLREIDRRVRFLLKRIDCAEVIDPSRQTNRSQVFFGATVTFVNERDEEKTVTILGKDEADMATGSISWQSPVARALMKAGIGDTVTVRTPAGISTLEVLLITYPSPDGSSEEV
ncbi:MULTISPECIES: transcription elongation factor GreB [unclassified Haematospirillum]|uniref:transcription elongation factor GreB n=1 Tax=unclassified Haematospirillum TaxID=2622088 RepID=UPI0014389D66|nr:MULTISPECIES: transcription elongation factor GreB [unclassified Haematospirillum]NKD55511.1 transcription elongation factor GreB [Haematospirillum sp. H4890]NKD75651.1 transcription elongation factor GreB [Haematospirillum sp. H4485]